MVERSQQESNWLRRYTSEQALTYEETRELDFSGDGYRQTGLNSQTGSTSTQGAETIFDFELPVLAEQEIAALHRRAEYLLDEMEMGAADGSAFEQETTARSTEYRWMDSRQNDNGLRFAEAPQFSTTRSQVLPDAALPSIRSRPQPTVEGTAPSRDSQSSTLTESPDASILASPTRRRTAPASAQTDRPRSISAHQIQHLEAEITQLSAQVNRLQEGRRDLTGHALSLLREASIILNTQPERAGRAEYNVRQVRMLLERSNESRRRSARYVALLLLYLSFWLTLCIGGLVALFLYGATLHNLLTDMSGQNSGLSIHTLPMLLTLLVGGLGGVVGAIASLIGQQRQGQEFDGQYVARYIVQPIMGVILALSIYAACIFLFTIQGVDFANLPLAQALPALIALPAGLWQEVVYAMLYRFSRVFRAGRRR